MKANLLLPVALIFVSIAQISKAQSAAGKLYNASNTINSANNTVNQGKNLANTLGLNNLFKKKNKNATTPTTAQPAAAPNTSTTTTTTTAALPAASSAAASAEAINTTIVTITQDDYAKVKALEDVIKLCSSVKTTKKNILSPSSTIEVTHNGTTSDLTDVIMEKAGTKYKIVSSSDGKISLELKL